MAKGKLVPLLGFSDVGKGRLHSLLTFADVGEPKNFWILTLSGVSKGQSRYENRGNCVGEARFCSKSDVPTLAKAVWTWK